MSLGTIIKYETDKRFSDSWQQCYSCVYVHRFSLTLFMPAISALNTLKGLIGLGLFCPFACPSHMWNYKVFVPESWKNHIYGMNIKNERTDMISFLRRTFCCKNCFSLSTSSLQPAEQNLWRTLVLGSRYLAYDLWPQCIDDQINFWLNYICFRRVVPPLPFGFISRRDANFWTNTWKAAWARFMVQGIQFVT